LTKQRDEAQPVESNSSKTPKDHLEPEGYRPRGQQNVNVKVNRAGTGPYQDREAKRDDAISRTKDPSMKPTIEMLTPTAKSQDPHRQLPRQTTLRPEESRPGLPP
jgi:hypothetical protein